MNYAKEVVAATVEVIRLLVVLVGVVGREGLGSVYRLFGILLALWVGGILLMMPTAEGRLFVSAGFMLLVLVSVFLENIEGDSDE